MDQPTSTPIEDRLLAPVSAPARNPQLTCDNANPSMQQALDNLGEALDRCLLQCVPAADVKYMIWYRFERLGDSYYKSRLARRRVTAGLPPLAANV